MRPDDGSPARLAASIRLSFVGVGRAESRAQPADRRVPGFAVGVLAVVREVLQAPQELEFDAAGELPRGSLEQHAVVRASAQLPPTATRCMARVV
jgi:hypothetical protein